MNRKIRIAVLSILGIMVCIGVQSKSRKSTSSAILTITTTDLCRSVRGYRGPVPISMTIKSGRIAEIKILPNHETPAYFRRVEQAHLTNRFIGLTPKQATSKQVDAVTGATLSSRALIQNIRAAAAEAQKKL